MTRLEGSIKRYIGLSTDDKPASSSGDTLPAGSSFFESDTWRISRFDGTAWHYERADSQVVGLLQELLAETRTLREQIELLNSKL